MKYIIHKILISVRDEDGTQDDILHEDELIDQEFDTYEEAVQVYDKIKVSLIDNQPIMDTYTV